MGRQVPGGRRQRRSGPRSRKGRPYRCDEAQPICGNCRKARLHCRQPDFVASKWNAFAPANVPPPAETTITPEIAHLLRVYENSIATWMDVFDANLTYQRRLLCMAPSSPLLLNTICALAARQLSLITCPRTWTPVAEHYYSLAVHLLARLLNAYPREMDLAIVATILLSSYELLASTGVDYQRHFKGAHTIVESLNAQRSESRLIRASFWIYARHEIAQALNRNSPTLHDPRSWPKANLTEGEMDEDAFCNDVLRLAAETVCVAFWKGIEYEEHGIPRYWFPRPNAAPALVFYHLLMLLLRLELDNVPEDPERQTENMTRDQIHAHSRQIILIALSSLPDSAVVVVVQPLCYAVKYVADTRLRERAVLLLDDVERLTGYHTKSKLERQLSR
ncbi:hypothetical protein BJY00DRAFT_304542 [Aspergillus carlsbadensis]|nr:hypothetical protein BJY00DRAFT_304542 [Aspergillus carlsbadensis]